VVSQQSGHEYSGIGGVQAFVEAALSFAYGANSAPLKEKRIAGIQTLSGTGACRVFGEFAARFIGKISLLIVASYEYFNIQM